LSIFEKKYSKIRIKKSLNDYFGYLYTVDLVSLRQIIKFTQSYFQIIFKHYKSVVVIENDKNEEHVIMNGEIENIELIEDNNPLNTDELFQSLFQTINIEQPKENLNEKRIKLIDLLEKKRIPIKLSDNNIISIMDSVFIHSP
jgi:hypothetical protein